MPTLEKNIDVKSKLCCDFFTLAAHKNLIHLNKEKDNSIGYYLKYNRWAKDKSFYFEFKFCPFCGRKKNSAIG